MNALGKASDAQSSTSFDSAVGTFTMQMSMKELVESLSYRMMLQGLTTLLAPASFDEDGYILSRAPDANVAAGEGKRGRDAATDFLNAGEVKALASDQKIVTTLLPAEILKYAARYSAQNQPLIMELAAKPVSDWENTLDPTGDTPDVLALRDQRAPGHPEGPPADHPTKAGRRKGGRLGRAPAARYRKLQGRKSRT